MDDEDQPRSGQEQAADRSEEERLRGGGWFFGRQDDASGQPSSPRPARPRWAGILAALTVLAVVIGGGAVLVSVGVERVRDMFSGPEDFSGEGSGSVLVEVEDGDTASVIGRKLEAAGVVASVEAFIEAAAENPEESRGIQVGHYRLRREMEAAEALEVLVDPGNLVQETVTVREGLTVGQTVEALAEGTDIPEARYRAAAQRAASLDLPGYARGDPEGFLFPATYALQPDATATSVLRMMVSQFRSEAEDLRLVRRAAAGNISPRDAVIVASLIEREVNRPEDLAGVAEVIYNRLNGRCEGTGGLLQLDSTVHYAAGANDSVFTTDEMRAVDSPYNTYRNRGLPPGPIASPGTAALDAALEPTDSGWCYFVAVDLETGETAFARTAAQHARNTERLREYCRGSDLC